VQEVIVADCSGHITLNVWEDQQANVKEGSSYVMKGLMVKEFHGCKCLTTPKENCTIEQIVTVSEDTPRKLQVLLVENVRVFAVDKLEKYSSCVQCSGKVMAMVDDNDTGECVLQMLCECKLTIVAQLYMKAENEERFSLVAFDDLVLKIAEVPADSITKQHLIKANAFNMKFSDGVIVNHNSGS